MQDRSTLVIDIPRIVNNYKVFSSKLKDNQKIMAVVKANAYGHGDVQVATALEKEGCSAFGVATIYEAIKLRRQGIKSTVLVLGYTPASCAKMLVKYNIHQAVVSKNHLQALLDTGLKIAVHFKIDTGMHRLGLEPNTQTENLIRKSLDKLYVKGVFTHLCVSDSLEYENFTKKQIRIFKNFTNSIQDLNLPFIHYHNSAGIINYNDKFCSHVRLGISLYGLKPNYYSILPKGVLPVQKWQTEIAMVKHVKKGDGIGYGLTFVAKQDMEIAIITTGYADGYSRRLSNVGTAYVKGKRVKVVGRVCMDQMTIDVTGLGVKMGDKVLLLCDEYTADDMAKDIGTISYEITSQITSRVKRTFKR